MTVENRRALVKAEMLRAAEAMREAEALARAGLPNGATSRAYYAAYHAASALLAFLDVRARTHRGVHALLDKHAVTAGLLSTESLARFARLQERRSTADYGASEQITAEQGVVILADANEFLDSIRKLVEGA